jgi:hypothetical protein
VYFLVRMHADVCIYAAVCMLMYADVCIFAALYFFMYVCMYVCMYAAALTVLSQLHAYVVMYHVFMFAPLGIIL